MRAMHYMTSCCLLLLALSLAGCGTGNVLTQEQIEMQNKSSRYVTEVLFENDLDTTASYNIRKDGLVVIKFDDSVSQRDYTRVVEQLRSSSAIPSVSATQKGVEVCPLR